MPTVAETMIATLKANGVKRIYGVAGDSLNGLTDAMRKDGTIDWLACGTRKPPHSPPGPRRR